MAVSAANMNISLLLGLKKWAGDNSTTHLTELGARKRNQNH